MRARVRHLLCAAKGAALAIALPLLLIGGFAHGGQADVRPDCGIAAWTGTCVCAAGPRAAPVSFETFARTRGLGADPAARAREGCGGAAAPRMK